MRTALIYIFDGDELVDVTLDESTAAAAAPTQIEREIVRIVREWKQLKENAVCFGKDVMFHRCTNGSIRPYHTGLCSTCLGKGEDFNAFERLRELEAEQGESEPGEFTEKMRARILRDQPMVDAETASFDQLVVIGTEALEHLEEACVVIDTKDERIKELEEAAEDAATACIDRSEHE